MDTEDYLTVWKNLDDVRKFSEYVEDRGIAQFKDENFQVVAETCAALKGKPLLLLSILTKAYYEVATSVEVLGCTISTNLKSLIDSYQCSFRATDLNSPVHYTIKWAWLLFLSQTEDCKGERMIDGFNLYPISIAKELLDKQTNGLKALADAVKTEIERVEA